MPRAVKEGPVERREDEAMRVEVGERSGCRCERTDPPKPPVAPVMRICMAGWENRGLLMSDLERENALYRVRNWNNVRRKDHVPCLEIPNLSSKYSCFMQINIEWCYRDKRAFRGI